MTQNDAFPSLTPHGDPRAQNALKFGLFAAAPCVREGEHEQYADIAAALRKDINPAGALQELLTGEIIGASWRLRRCNLVEAHLATQFDLDPMLDEGAGGKIQKSVDRARAQSHTIIRRSLAEMRKLQTEQSIHAQLGGQGLEDISAVLKAVAAHGSKPNVQPEPALPSLNGPLSIFDIDPDKMDMNNPEHFAAFDRFIQTVPLLPANALKTKEDLFCKTPPKPVALRPEPVRNRPCPCGSGIKYKRCCGSQATSDGKIAA